MSRLANDPSDFMKFPKVRNVNDVWWYEAPLPPRRHTCAPHSVMEYSFFEEAQRCACGAIRNPYISKSWMEVNSRMRPSWFRRLLGSVRG